MKTRMILVVSIGITAAFVAGLVAYSSAYNQNCVRDGMVTGFLECTSLSGDFVSAQHPSKIILKVTDPIDSRGLAPLITTQVYENIGPNATIQERSYLPTNHGERLPGDMGTSWDRLPDSFHVGMKVVDENGTDAIDRDVKSTFDRTASILITRAACGDKTVEILAGGAVPVPIKNDVSTVFAENSAGGLIPNDSGQYLLEFASFFKQEIELPDNAVVLSSTSEKCHTITQNPNPAYYDRVVFELKE